jgi:hypothetical protein
MRDAFLGRAKTCAKLEIAFWDYLGDRLAVPGTHTVPRLPEIMQPATGAATIELDLAGKYPVRVDGGDCAPNALCAMEGCSSRRAKLQR